MGVTAQGCGACISVRRHGEIGLVVGDTAGQSQEAFCAASWPKLVAAMSQYCGDVHVAEELVQEALVRACQRWRHVSSLSSPEGWTFRVAVNLANSRWRRHRAAQRARERHGPESDRRLPVAVEEQLAVREALATLTAKQRQAVVLRHVLELSVAETAQVMGISAGATRGLTHRAVGRLRAALDGSDVTSEEITDAG